MVSRDPAQDGADGRTEAFLLHTSPTPGREPPPLSLPPSRRRRPRGPSVPPSLSPVRVHRSSSFGSPTSTWYKVASSSTAWATAPPPPCSLHPSRRTTSTKRAAGCIGYPLAPHRWGCVRHRRRASGQARSPAVRHIVHGQGVIRKRGRMFRAGSVVISEKGSLARLLDSTNPVPRPPSQPPPAANYCRV